jgi:hypothetical protein
MQLHHRYRPSVSFQALNLRDRITLVFLYCSGLLYEQNTCVALLSLDHLCDLVNAALHELGAMLDLSIFEVGTRNN